MDLPAGPVQEYITIAGIAAVYVASSSSGACRIDVTRDPKRTQTMLRKQDHDLTIVGAFWVDDAKTATKIANRISKPSWGASLTEAEATAQITATAAEMKVHLTEHAAVIQRVESAVAHVKMTLEQARKNGGLKWFNRAFHDFRLRAKTCGHPPMTYAQARARLRRAVVQRVLSGKHSEFGAEILLQVFPELPGQPNLHVC
jgi:hypothetical protein